MFGRHLRAGPRPHIRPFAAGRSPTRERTSTHPVQNSPNTPPPAAQPVQNSPCSAGPSAQPVQNSPNTPKKAHFSQFCTSRENFLPHPAPRPPAGRTLYRAQCQTRYKTLPVQPVRRPNRYKTLPTRPKRPISASFARAGRTFYRTQHHDPQQGELCTAPSAKPGTKLSQHAHKCPFQPVLPEQGELCTAPSAKNPVQNSPSAPFLQRFREKVRPAHLKTAFFASFAPAGRTYSRRGLDRTR